MKVNITLDGTPDEVRAFFGWPPLATLQEEWLNKMREQMAAGADPSALFKSMMPGGFPGAMPGMTPGMSPTAMSPDQLQNLFAMQQAFWQQMNTGKTEK
ncbi:hypothetical protein HPT27_04185 [Permianibacter sp. IMCC34836]|uniref:hypothetical protein n=1 Tax=Permianibacter fluminis TaxID=2738515 RepID=UPI001557ABEC|nr:hypothetical protein [Permianibacter fluminis]NQD36212.1 hypothetical protein [Permianibacter fluminis]